MHESDIDEDPPGDVSDFPYPKLRPESVNRYLTKDINNYLDHHNVWLAYEGSGDWKIVQICEYSLDKKTRNDEWIIVLRDSANNTLTFLADPHAPTKGYPYLNDMDASSFVSPM